MATELRNCPSDMELTNLLLHSKKVQKSLVNTILFSILLVFSLIGDLFTKIEIFATIAQILSNFCHQIFCKLIIYAGTNAPHIKRMMTKLLAFPKHILKLPINRKPIQSPQRSINNNCISNTPKTHLSNTQNGSFATLTLQSVTEKSAILQQTPDFSLASSGSYCSACSSPLQSNRKINSRDSSCSSQNKNNQHQQNSQYIKNAQQFNTNQYLSNTSSPHIINYDEPDHYIRQVQNSHQNLTPWYIHNKYQSKNDEFAHQVSNISNSHTNQQVNTNYTAYNSQTTENAHYTSTPPQILIAKRSKSALKMTPSLRTRHQSASFYIQDQNNLELVKFGREKNKNKNSCLNMKKIHYVNLIQNQFSNLTPSILSHKTNIQASKTTSLTTKTAELNAEVVLLTGLIEEFLELKRPLNRKISQLEENNLMLKNMLIEVERNLISGDLIDQEGKGLVMSGMSLGELEKTGYSNLNLSRNTNYNSVTNTKGVDIDEIIVDQSVNLDYVDWEIKRVQRQQ
ncbi:hypothetical protein SS50377_28381 [Spironucleus salmonicida]|uniref:Uncharacterized protein n=1 Tax=Spironucleus salmonicida TaxID=348837 RepID=V6LY43_9EUKA|nr:hypothetical protein SS50377_28381 [Spironucleus salmonicida]|eukprot:EST49572.1 Hypothetical protein SS50377_10073 [Spironucleus salmonicida]